MLTHRPDSSELSQNVLVSISNLLPVSDGSWRAPYATEASTLGTISAAQNVPINTHFAIKPDGTARLFFGGATRLYETVAGVWTDRSAGGSAYTTVGSWHFVQYGATTYAASIENTIQKSASGAFAAETNAPKAKIIEALEGALIALNYNDGTAVPNGISVSDIDDPTTWTPAASNTAYKVTLTDTPGEITAGIRFRDFVVVFKQRAMYLLQLIAGPPWWEVRLFSADVGCVGKDACIVAGDKLYFLDDSDVYSFDGAVIQSVAQDVKKSLIANLRAIAGGDLRYISCQYDDMNQLVNFYGAELGVALRCWAYNHSTGEWGFQNGDGAEVNVGVPIKAPNKAFRAFSGAPTMTNENRLCVVTNVSPDTKIVQNGHGMADMAVGGSAITAYFGDAFKAQLISRLFMNSDSNTGVTVSITAKRAPRSSAATQSTSATASVSADLLADLMCNGNFFKVTWTFATTAAFTMWRDYGPQIQAAGRN